jgi:Rrf2 family nitric oxide-sensitive transcriptional repressor
VRQTEGDSVPAECFGEGGGECSIAGICRLSGVLAEAVRAFYGALDQYTLADLVHNRQALARVMFVDPETRAARRAA